GADRPYAHRKLQQARHRRYHGAHARRPQPATLDEDHRLPADLLDEGAEHRQDHIRRADDAHIRLSRYRVGHVVPDDEMELVVFANSPIGSTGQFFRDVVTQIYLDNIAPEIPVGGW